MPALQNASAVRGSGTAAPEQGVAETELQQAGAGAPGRSGELMDRLSKLVAGVLVGWLCLGLAGCSMTATPEAADTGTQKGVAGKFYYVNLFTPPLGGIVTSDVGGIRCGAQGVAVASGASQYSYTYYAGASACGTHGQTRFEWNQEVTLTASPQGGAFLGWAGDCTGTGPCKLKAGADKSVVAIFGQAGGGHANFTDPALHGPAFANQALTCTGCHGAALQGKGIAPSCSACHAWPLGQYGEQRYSLGGSVAGLTGSGLVLASPGEPDLNVPAGATTFAFTGTLLSGAAYAVTVLQQPAGQTCTVTGGAGTVAGANVTSVAISCVVALRSVGGTVSGLAGSGLVLRDNGGDDLPVTASGPFTFATPVASGAPYAVTVRPAADQPGPDLRGRERRRRGRRGERDRRVGGLRHQRLRPGRHGVRPRRRRPGPHRQLRRRPRPGPGRLRERRLHLRAARPGRLHLLGHGEGPAHLADGRPAPSPAGPAP